jgi:hypothetical protein
MDDHEMKWPVLWREVPSVAVSYNCISVTGEIQSLNLIC